VQLAQRWRDVVPSSSSSEKPSGGILDRLEKCFSCLFCLDEGSCHNLVPMKLPETGSADSGSSSVTEEPSSAAWQARKRTRSRRGTVLKKKRPTQLDTDSDSELPVMLTPRSHAKSGRRNGDLLCIPYDCK